MPAFEVTVRLRDDERADSAATSAADTPAMSSIPLAMSCIPGPAMSSIPLMPGSPAAGAEGDLSPLSGR